MIRGFTIEPQIKRAGDRWVLTLWEDGEPCGGGVFPWAVDQTGFDAGYQDALDQGEDWVQS